MSRLQWFFLILKRYYRRMGLRVALYALLSLLIAFLGPLTGTLLGETVSMQMSFDSVLPVLTILATSMLAVSTFSLNVMVAAHRAASDTTTPRVHRILLEDTTTQSVLASFIGAFVYSLGAIILYRAGFYAEESAPLVMALTIVVVVLVVVSLLRWIDHLTGLGSVDDSLAHANARARDVLLALARYPAFGAMPLTANTVIPFETRPLAAPASGVVQLIDMARLSKCLPVTGAIYIRVRPGQHVLEGETIGEVSGPVSDAQCEEMLDALTIGTQRTHEQDAEFGLTVLSETASKALSPGINDAGTAIQALLLLKTLLWDHARTAPEARGAHYTGVFVSFPSPDDLVEAAFAAVARDGAGTIEVALHLQRALTALTQAGDAELAAAARRMADRALAYSERAGMPAADIERLRAVPVGGGER